MCMLSATSWGTFCSEWYCTRGERTRRVILAALTGSVLADLVDMPLGSLLTRPFGNGILSAYALLVFMPLLLAGVALRWMCSRMAFLLVLAAAAGFLSPHLPDTILPAPFT